MVFTTVGTLAAGAIATLENVFGLGMGAELEGPSGEESSFVT